VGATGYPGFVVDVNAIAVVRIRIVDEQERIDEARAAQQTAGDVGIQRQPDVGCVNHAAARRRLAALALHQQVADELRDPFHAVDHGRAGIGRASERQLVVLLLRVCRTGAQQQGDESERKEQFAKICHFLLLVKM